MQLLWVQAEITSSTKGADKQAGMVQTSVPNENIKWETTRSVNIALDLGFFNNRIQTTFEWFDKKTSDILMQLAMPGIFLGSLRSLSECGCSP